jgi:hypothetical protein
MSDSAREPTPPAILTLNGRRYKIAYITPHGPDSREGVEAGWYWGEIVEGGLLGTSGPFENRQAALNDFRVEQMRPKPKAGVGPM